MRNLVICCDGTNNQLLGDLTNVVRVFEISIKDPAQKLYYDPGVGTTPDPLEKGQIRKRWSMIKGLAFGAGLKTDVLEAYKWLMATYQEGDRIYLFGFSRGSFSIRVLAGMLHGVGLLHAGSENLLPYLWKAYRRIRRLPEGASEREKRKVEKCQREIDLLRRSFTRVCPVHFLGPWDTVGSVGMYNWNQSFAYTFKNPSVSIVRHAMALDERRAAFRSNAFKADSTILASQPGRRRVMNVWFPGVHSDIGGGYPWDQSTLAMISFKWMVEEAVKAGLRVDAGKFHQLLADCPPDACGEIHESLKGAWWILEFLPARRYNWEKLKTIWRFSPNKERTPIESPIRHQSISDRMAQKKEYRPTNLKDLPDPPTEP